MAKEKMATVTVVKGRSWDGGPLGSRDDSSPPFEYDVGTDPQQLVALGLVEAVPAKAEGK